MPAVRWKGKGGWPAASLDLLLTNVIDTGRGRHRGVIFPGEHEGMVDLDRSLAIRRR